MSNRIAHVCTANGITVEELVRATRLSESTIQRMLRHPNCAVNEDTAARVTAYIERRVGPQKHPLFEHANLTTTGRPPLTPHSRTKVHAHDPHYGVCGCGLVLLRNGNCSGDCT